MANNYYDTLGISKNASPDEIKRAFRKLAHQHHPDKTTGDEKKFKEINEAYQVLSNGEKRKQYDQFGQTFDQARAQGGFGGFNASDFANAFRGSAGAGQNFSFEFSDLGDVFGDLFGLGGTRSRTQTGSRSRAGADISVEITISFEDAVFGSEKTLNLKRDVVCSRCQGKGGEPGSKLSTCSTCRGRGQVTQNIGLGIGFQSVCPDCQGVGQQPEKKCQQCHGRGTMPTEKTITVKIPAGINDGQTIRLAGEGQTVAAGQTGDLYVRVRVIPSKEFRRQGDDISTKKEISFRQAALGDKIGINTIDGPVKLKIPEGTQSGRLFRIAGKGVPHLQGRGRGDHLVEVIVRTPTRLSRKEKKLLADLP
jgi:molecular chaperone DnaJ